MISCWVQKSDFESTDYGEIDAHHAIKTLHSFDWESEENRRVELEQKGQEVCDCGMGLVSEDGRKLHIGRVEPGKAYFHYHYYQQHRFLGIPLGQSRQIISRIDVNWDDLDDFIHHFFENDHSWLVARAA